ncbi:MAG: class I SAM-dependent methyltransferase [Candidatus Acidiferrales bacterium]
MLSSPKVDFYDAQYSRFAEELYRAIRLETHGEDIGQNGWLSAAEHDLFLSWLELRPEDHLLDVACGSGGPSLRIAQRERCRVTGIDIHADAIARARESAAGLGLQERATFEQQERATFEQADAAGTLPFGARTFDALICVDAINHLSHRAQVIAEWVRVVKPGGRIVFTDPIVVTGELSNEEIAIRSSIGYFLFVPPGEDRRLLTAAGCEVLREEDCTANTARAARQWRQARAKREAALRQIEGDASYEGQQRFLDVAAQVAEQQRLSRFAYLARTPR